MADGVNPRIGLLRAPRPKASLAPDERAQLFALGTQRDVAAKMHTSNSTAAELMSPHGVASIKTIAKVRAMLAEMRGEVLG